MVSEGIEGARQVCHGCVGHLAGKDRGGEGHDTFDSVQVFTGKSLESVFDLTLKVKLKWS